MEKRMSRLDRAMETLNEKRRGYWAASEEFKEAKRRLDEGKGDAAQWTARKEAYARANEALRRAFGEVLAAQEGAYDHNERGAGGDKKEGAEGGDGIAGAARIVLRFPPPAISNQVPLKNPSAPPESPVFRR